VTQETYLFHATIREKASTSDDLPLSHECKRVLAYGAEEAEQLSHKHIGTEHLLLGLLREEKCFAAEILHERGLRLSTIREELARWPSEKISSTCPKEGSQLSQFSRDLTQAAIDNSLDPLIGRDYELERVMQILCRRTKNNPVLSASPVSARRPSSKGSRSGSRTGTCPRSWPTSASWRSTSRSLSPAPSTAASSKSGSRPS
jgi:ATP-dependent Clp protease ATP-binding subunit ClpA